MIISVTSSEELHALTSRNGSVVLADFYADWCEPCKMLDEILYRIQPRLPASLKIIKVNTELLPDLRQEYRIMSVPTLILFKDGAIAWRYNGFMMDDQLVDAITIGIGN